MRTLAGVIADRLGVRCEPILRGEYRPGEMRDLVSDITLARRLGFVPMVDLDHGISRYLDWLAGQPSTEDRFSHAEVELRRNGIVQPATAATATAKGEQP